jgi:hypothetical protein
MGRLLWGVMGTVVAASPAPAVAEGGQGRRLGDHVFVESESLDGPFVTTSIASLTGVGIASADLSADLDQDGFDDGLDLSLGLFQQGFQLSVAPVEWLALQATMSGQILAGSNVDTALLLGVRGGYSYTLGAKVRVWRADSLQVGASLAVDVDNGIQFSPLRAITESINAGRITRNSLLSKSASTDLKPGVQVAYAFGPTLGIWTSASYERTVDHSGSADEDSSFEVGAGLSINLNDAHDIPLGFDLTAVTGSSGETTSRSGGVGVYYTGRPELQTGVEVAVGSQTSDDLSLDLSAGLFKLRYYW